MKAISRELSRLLAKSETRRALGNALAQSNYDEVIPFNGKRYRIREVGNIDAHEAVPNLEYSKSTDEQ